MTWSVVITSALGAEHLRLVHRIIARSFLPGVCRAPAQIYTHLCRLQKGPLLGDVMQQQQLDAYRWRQGTSSRVERQIIVSLAMTSQDARALTAPNRPGMRPESIPAQRQLTLSNFIDIGVDFTTLPCFKNADACMTAQHQPPDAYKRRQGTPNQSLPVLYPVCPAIDLPNRVVMQQSRKSLVKQFILPRHP